jgi:hypothetical protein
MFPVEEIWDLARTLRAERMVFRGDQFHIIRRFLRLPQNIPIANNPLVKGGQKLAQRILPKKKTHHHHRKIKRSLVE